MVVTSDSPIIDPNPKQDLEPLLTVPPPVLTNPFHLLEEGDKVEDDNSDSPLTPTPSDLNLLPNFIAFYGGLKRLLKLPGIRASQNPNTKGSPKPFAFHNSIIISCC